MDGRRRLDFIFSWPFEGVSCFYIDHLRFGVEHIYLFVFFASLT